MESSHQSRKNSRLDVPKRLGKRAGTPPTLSAISSIRLMQNMACLVFDRVQQSACGVVHRDAATDSIGDVDEAARLVYDQAKGNKTHLPG